MTTPTRTIRLAEVVYEDLALRDSVTRVFDSIDDSPESDIVVDFSGVRSISRSFADEYVQRRSRSTKAVREVNVPDNVRQMIDVVSRGPKAKRKFDTDQANLSIT